MVSSSLDSTRWRKLKKIINENIESMAKKSLKTLCKAYEFENDYEYFDYIIESLINGNLTQCRELFNDLREADKKSCIRYIREIGTDYANDTLICLGY